MIPPLRIALSGGGMKGLSHVGALEALDEKGLLRCVKEYIGTSAGALIAFCMVCGYTLPEMRVLCTQFDFTLVQNLDPDIILQFPEKFGFDNGANVERLLDILLKKKGIPPEITFEEFAAKFPDRPSLRAYAIDIHTCLPKEFSLKNTPRAKLAQAIRASMSIPFFFTPVIDSETGHFLVDGGLLFHFPFHHLSDEERKETLGIAFSDMNRSVTELFSRPDEVFAMGLAGYILRIYYSAYYSQNVELYSNWSHRIILVECGSFPSIHFDATTDQKTELLELGSKGVAKFLSRPVKTIARRNSIA